MYLKEQISNWLFKRHINKVRQKYTTSASGDCMIVYFIKRYINGEDDYIAEYEKILDNHMDDTELAVEMEKFLGHKLTEDQFRQCLAHKYTCILLLLQPEAKRESYYELISDKQVRALTQSMVEMRTVNETIQAVKEAK